ncbi:MAG: iron ABC transporter permease, partial [Dehalococcoidia bacterium]|nr:iron ABC transporter permease [Dehalococcoidia bacterium]
RGVTPETMILAGIALMYLFSALTATLQFIATEQQLQSVVYWTFGSLTRASWNGILLSGTILFIALPFLMRYAWAMNAMASGGDEVAKSLGINTSKVRIVSSLLVVLIAAAIISFTGVIGFVGLVAPHIARLIIGGDHRFLIPYSGIVGGILVVAADTIGKTVFSPAIIPVGIVISYLGVPLFIHLILTRRREYF